MNACGTVGWAVREILKLLARAAMGVRGLKGDPRPARPACGCARKAYGAVCIGERGWGRHL